MTATRLIRKMLEQNEPEIPAEDLPARAITDDPLVRSAHFQANIADILTLAEQLEDECRRVGAWDACLKTNPNLTERDMCRALLVLACEDVQDEPKTNACRKWLKRLMHSIW